MATKVKRGGEVLPDSPNKGSDADRNRHVYGIPEGVPSKENGGQPNQEQGGAEKDRQKRGNRGPDEEPGFGQGA